MWKLQKVFSSGGLFQAESVLTVRGFTDGEQVSGCIRNADGESVFYAAVPIGKDGAFTLELTTPAASYEPHTITLDNGTESYVMEDVLFGELWLAAGQSNMEMFNWAMTNASQVYDDARNKHVRLFHVENYPDVFNGVPFEPDPYVNGWWLEGCDWEKAANVSALALRFAIDLYDFLNKNAEVPVGILSASWGGTGMAHWLPGDAIREDAYMAERMKQVGAYPNPHDWNGKEWNNARQPTAQYNIKIAPLLGVRVRSLIWYQGENDCGWETLDRRIYADYLRFFYRIYKERFAAGEQFMMLSSLLFPWTYGPSGECHVGYLNQCFIETAAEAPDKFGYVPIGDLNPVWDFHHSYQPIHPANKYPVGRRLARLAIAAVYGGAEQKAPARLVESTPDGNRLHLRFDSVSDGLRVEGERAHCLYVAGADGKYMPAEFAITAPDQMTVWNDAVSEPINAAYAVQSMETGCNLYAGDYPVTPFFTDSENRPILIEARPWYDTTTNAVWVRQGEINDDVQNVFYQPIWEPLPGSAVCQDTAFRRKAGASIRVSANDSTFGCFVRSYMYNKLDFANYNGLSVDLMNTEKLKVTLTLEYESGDKVIDFTERKELEFGWKRYTATFGDLPEGEIQRMVFRFDQGDSLWQFVNLERVRLF